MYKELVIAPMIVVFLLGFALQLTDIAESTSAKVLNYADDMNRALDCATSGISIYNCSPNLNSYDFKEDAKEYKKFNEEYIEQLVTLFENATITEKNDTILIEIKKE